MLFRSDRRDFQLLSEYAQGRAFIQAQLDELGVKSLDSKAASEAGLAVAWETFVNELIAQDVGFAQMYDRELDSDNLTGVTW